MDASATTTTSAETLQSRLPDPGKLIPEMADIGKNLFRAVGNGTVPKTTIGLIQLRVGLLVGSTYLTVLHTGNLRRAGETEERITAVASWQDAPYYSEAERAALALVDAVHTANPHGERVPDELYAEASAHYDDRALATIIMAIGQIGFYMPLALIGKPLPGVSPSKQWRS